MNDVIDRQAAIDAIEEMQMPIMRSEFAEEQFVFKGMSEALHAIKALPSAQPELPKQFMSDDCISRSELYKKVCEAEKLARERVLDTPSNSPFPNKLNPAYTRYSAQLDERTQFKHMIADARSVQPEIIRCKNCTRFDKKKGCNLVEGLNIAKADSFCSYGERREDE